MKKCRNVIILFLIFNLIFINFCFADDIYIYDELESFDFSNVSNSSISEPTTLSKHIIVIDRKTLSVLYEKAGYAKTPMASTTKIMTCILALENCSLNKKITVSKKAASVNGSTLGLNANMEISINDLIYGLMLRSGNDCAIALAEEISGSVENFSNLMNKKAKELHLENTNFVTPHGLDDENHFTTAYDLALLTNYALKNDTFKQIVSTKNYTINFNNYPRTISNTNELLGNLDGVYGVKTGFTFNAGRCLVSSCKRNDLDIIVVVLGADTKKIRTQDSYNLINYIFNNYKYVDISNTLNDSFKNYLTYYKDKIYLEKTTDFPIFKLEELNNYSFPLKTNGEIKLSTKIFIINKFSPKITKGTKVGSISLYNNDNLLCETSIILTNQLKINSWKFYYKKIITNLFYN